MWCQICNIRVVKLPMTICFKCAIRNRLKIARQAEKDVGKKDGFSGEIQTKIPSST